MIYEVIIDGFTIHVVDEPKRELKYCEECGQLIAEEEGEKYTSDFDSNCSTFRIPLDNAFRIIFAWFGVNDITVKACGDIIRQKINNDVDKIHNPFSLCKEDIDGWLLTQEINKNIQEASNFYLCGLISKGLIYNKFNPNSTCLVDGFNNPIYLNATFKQ